MRYVLALVLLTGCGSVSPANVPPEGTIWFGQSFDPDTFELSGRTDTVSQTETFAFVGNVGDSVDASELNVRVLYDGQAVANQSANASGSGEVWGFTYGPLFSAGEWTIQLTDVGGNVLASGDLTATE